MPCLYRDASLVLGEQQEHQKLLFLAPQALGAGGGGTRRGTSSRGSSSWAQRGSSSISTRAMRGGSSASASSHSGRLAVGLAAPQRDEFVPRLNSLGRGLVVVAPASTNSTATAVDGGRRGDRLLDATP